MSKTPITDQKQFDALPYFLHGQVFARKVVMADDMRELERELAEARAEIERMSDALCRAARRNGADGKASREAIERRDKLIEQMLDALKDVLQIVAKSDEIPWGYDGDGGAIALFGQISDACDEALSAAERGE